MYSDFEFREKHITVLHTNLGGKLFLLRVKSEILELIMRSEPYRIKCGLFSN